MESTTLGFWELLSSANAAQIKAFAANNLWFTLALCFGSGILTSFTPCVYPVIPITINIFGRMGGGENDSQRRFSFKVFRLAAIYVAGMCTTYSILGLIAGMTGSLFGSLLQSGFMLGFLTILFLVLALGQFGLFELSLPASWQTKLATKGHSKSVFGIFLMGLFAGLIISPCVGPIVAGILAFVFESSNAWLGMIYFFSFSLGLGLLFLVIGGFSGALARLPRSGSWMKRINRVLAILLLIASAYYGVLWMKKLGIMNRSIPVSGTAVQWITNEAEALKQAQQNNLPVIIDFSAEWCEVCHEIEETIFNNPVVVSKMRNTIVPLRIDLTEETEQNQQLRQKYGVIGLPTLIFLNRQGEILAEPRINGTITPEEYLIMLNKMDLP